MIKQSIYILSALLIFATGIPRAQEKTTVMTKTETGDTRLLETITKAELRDHVFYLASDFTGGRLPGSDGYKQASCYVASQLIETGLTPILNGPDGKKCYFQNVDFTISSIAPQSVLHVKIGEKEIEWKLGEQFLPLLHNQEFDKGTYEGTAEFVGYGIEETAYGWNDYKNRNVSGKMVILYIGAPMKKDKPILPEEKNESYLSMQQGLMNRMLAAFGHKATGVIIIPDPQTTEMWSMLSPHLNRPCRRLKAFRAQDPVVPIPVFLVHPEAAAELFEGTGFDPISGKGNVESIHLTDVRLVFDLKYETQEDFTCRNVVGFLPGSDPVLDDEYIVVCAHLDHLGTKENEVFNGADDNASGCAAVLEAAEAVAMSPPKRSIFFVFFTGEEGAGQGSYYFINNFFDPLEKIKLAINVDMVGRNSPEHPNAVLGVTPDNIELGLAEFMEEANRSLANVNLKTRASGENFGDYYGSGDEAMFMLRGIPAVLVTTGFGWPEYHQPGDDPDKIDYDRVTDASRLVFSLITAAANNEIPH